MRQARSILQNLYFCRRKFQTGKSTILLCHNVLSHSTATHAVDSAFGAAQEPRGQISRSWSPRQMSGPISIGLEQHDRDIARSLGNQR